MSRRHFSNYIFLNVNVWISIAISLKFGPKGPIDKKPAWFKWWLGAEQVTSHYLNQWWLSLLTHICITRPQWVNRISNHWCMTLSTHARNLYMLAVVPCFVVRRAGLLWSQQDFEWRWSVPLFKCLTVLEFSVILFDLCLLITFFNFIMNYVPIVTFWIFTYHKIWILSIMFCFIQSYWIIYFLACLEVSWRVVS